MKKTLTLLAFTALSLITFAQLNNQSFENWESPMLHNTINATIALGGITVYVCDDFDYNELENWSSTNQLTRGSNLGNIELVTLSTNAVDGSNSVKIETKEISLSGYFIPGCFGTPTSIDNTAPGLIVNGSFNLDVQTLVNDIVTGSGLNALNPFNYPGVGEAIDFIPKTISGYYQYTGGIDGSTVDSCIIVSGLKKNGVLIGHVVQRFGNASSLTPFSISYEHLNCEVPDTIVTVISSSSIDLEIVNGEFIINSDFTGIDGSVLFLDALHLDTILPSEFPPILYNDSSTIFTYETATNAVQTNDIFCDNMPTTPILLYTGSEGTASVNGSNEIIFTPSTGYDGTVDIPYYNCNTVPACDTAHFYVIVLPVAVCEAFDDNYTLTMGTTTTNDPKLNDMDCGNAITILDGPTQGVADLDFANNLNYSPNSTFTGSDSLTYYSCNTVNTTQCDTATVRYTITPVGINEIDANLIKFYPNPANNFLNIVVDIENEVTINIFNTLGELVLNTNFENSKLIDIKTITNGLYFVEIKAGDKKTVKKLQIIK